MATRTYGTSSVPRGGGGMLRPTAAMLGLMLLAALAPPAGAVQETAPEPPEPAAPLYDGQADARVQIAQALQRAQAGRRRVLIQWGANWCVWCRRLQRLFETHAELRRTLEYEYELVHADIGGWDRHLDLAQSYGAHLKGDAGVPFLTILDADGKVLANQPTGPLETADPGELGHDPQKVLAFLRQHQAPYPEAAGLLEAALERAGEEDKRLFLHFGAPWCGWCHRLEAWLQRPQVAALLARDFVLLKIDVDRTLGGQELLAELRGSERGGIPWFVFLDAEGQALASSTGPQGGNVGFPAQEQEIAHLVSMLRAAARQLGQEDIAALAASLEPLER